MLGSRISLVGCTLLAALGGALAQAGAQSQALASEPSAAPAPGAEPGGTLAYALQVVALPGTPVRVAAADLDGDGDRDLVVTLTGNPALNVLALLQGPSGYTPSWSAMSGVGFNVPLDLDLGDVDLDGDPDLVTTFPNAFNLRLNNGDGTFGPSTGPTGTSLAVDNEVTDTNGDGIPDASWVVEDILGYVGSAKGNGDGTFDFTSEESVFGFGNFSKGRLTIAEVTGGPPKDLVFAHPGGLHLMHGMLIGGETKFVPPPNLIATGSFYDVDFGNLDGGRPDLVASLPLSHSVVVLLGKTDTSNPGPPVSFPAGIRPGPLATGDFDGDGFIDVATGNHRGATISVLLGNGSGGLLPPLSFPSARVAVDLEAADMHGDGDLDLIAADDPGKRVVLLLKL
jgi:hypothetical protein